MSDEATKSQEDQKKAESQEDHIDAEELATLKDKGQKFDDIELEATNAGFADSTEYLDFLSEKKLEDLEKTPEKKVAITKKVEQPPVDNTRADEAHRIGTEAYLQGQYTEFLMLQSALPEKERTSFTKKELNTLIRGKQYGAIDALSKSEGFDDNLFAAAAFFKDIPNMKKTALKKGADSEKILNDARKTAIPITGQKPAVEEEVSDGQKLADMIAPDNAPEFAD